MATPEYQAVLQDAGAPPDVRSFHCASLISEGAHDLSDAAELALNAAWAADDASSPDLARAHRERTATLMIRAMPGDLAPDCPESEFDDRIQLLDVLRRARRFDAARDLAEKLIPHANDEIAEAVLRFHIAAAARADDGCYTISDVEQWAAPPPARWQVVWEGLKQAVRKHASYLFSWRSKAEPQRRR